MGTPDFAAVCLQGLYDAGHEVCGVFTQPDKPKNRGMKLEQSPVKKLALAHGTPVFQPQKLRDGAALAQIRALEPELLCVVAYGRILPDEILQAAPRGSVNIHGSLLPKYRGAAPIQWTVLNGEPVGGVTAQYMAAAMDAGDIIDYSAVPVGEYETSGELFERLSRVGADLLCRVVEQIAAGTVKRTPQDESMATYAPQLTRADSPVNWDASPKAVIDRIRGLDPWPSATAVLGEQKQTFKLFRAIRGREEPAGDPGTILGATRQGLESACRGGTVIVTELQAPGGKRMKAADYLRGHKL